uniref:Uncharacterized protein n=1 Tax=Oryza glaberrima TaxID=4538 RepID=I1R0Z7_ORYGL
MAAATGDEEDVEETQGYRIGRMATREAKDGCGRCRSPGLAMGDGRRIALHLLIDFVVDCQHPKTAEDFLKLSPSPKVD